jgi:hypothetical protein
MTAEVQNAGIQAVLEINMVFFYILIMVYSALFNNPGCSLCTFPPFPSLYPCLRRRKNHLEQFVHALTWEMNHHLPGVVHA